MGIRAQNLVASRSRNFARSGAMIALLAVGLRAAAIAPAVAASAATVVALAALAFGLALHGRHHGRRWQVMWTLLSTALAVQSIATTHAALIGLPTQYPASMDWISVGCAVGVAVALCGLLSMRARGCAVDATLEGALIAAVCLYLPFVWAVTHGTGQREALAVMTPVAVWIVVAWLLFRLLFLTSEQIVAYRYLGAAAVGIAIAGALTENVAARRGGEKRAGTRDSNRSRVGNRPWRQERGRDILKAGWTVFGREQKGGCLGDGFDNRRSGLRRACDCRGREARRLAVGGRWANSQRGAAGGGGVR
jgi:hypothetical protein